METGKFQNKIYKSNLKRIKLFNLYSSCNTILKKLDSLEEAVPPKLKVYTECLKKFNIVKQKCLGQVLLDGYEESIEDFKKSYQKINSSGINKVHDLVDHLAFFLKRKGKNVLGAGYFSEQNVR